MSRILPGIQLVQDLQQPCWLDIGIGSANAVPDMLLHQPENNSLTPIVRD